MPTATSTLRKFAEDNFGSLDISGPTEALERAGFVLTGEYCWRRKQPPSQYEWACINFLIQEWDWGGYSED